MSNTKLYNVVYYMDKHKTNCWCLTRNYQIIISSFACEIKSKEITQNQIIHL